MEEVREQFAGLKARAGRRLKLPQQVLAVASAEGMQGIAALLERLGGLLGDGRSL